MSLALEFAKVSKQFYLQHERPQSLQERFVQIFRRREKGELFWVLRDVSFGVEDGETFGILGRNGAGKSTILKLATGILKPTSGQVRRHRRTHAMLELGAGFHPELSGRDNIFLNGSIHGLGRARMRSLLDRIVAFAELERFIDTPVKHYSSGMFMRLGFATAIHMEPELLIVDEILAVGDAAFRRKCTEALRQLKDQGVTIVFVSHDEGAIYQFCDRALLLAGGRVAAVGAVDEVVTAYTELLEGTAAGAAVGGRGLRIHTVTILDAANQERLALPPDEPWALEVTCSVPAAGILEGEIMLLTETGSTVVAARLNRPVHPGETGLRHLRACFDRLPLAAGRLRASARLKLTTADGSAVAEHNSPYSLTVGDQTHAPLLDLPYRWVDRSEPAASSPRRPPASPAGGGDGLHPTPLHQAPGPASPPAALAAATGAIALTRPRPGAAAVPEITGILLPAGADRQQVMVTVRARYAGGIAAVEYSLDGETYVAAAALQPATEVDRALPIALANPAAGGSWAGGRRPIYLRARGADDALSAPSLRTIDFTPDTIVARYLAEGYTGAGFDQYLTLTNPTGEPIDVTIACDYSSNVGGRPGTVVSLAPDRQQTLPIWEVAGSGHELSLLLQSDRPFTAERWLFFHTYPAPGGVAYNRAQAATLSGVSGGHRVAAAPAPAAHWYFAEGYTGAGFEVYFAIYNPNATPIRVLIVYILPGGARARRWVAIGARQRSTVVAHQADAPGGLGPDHVFAAEVIAGPETPIVVERVIYFSYPGSTFTAGGGTAAFGAAAAATRAYFAESGTAAGVDRYLALYNPGDEAGLVTLTYCLDDQPAAVTRQVPLAARSRATVLVHAEPAADNPGGLGRGQAAGLILESTVPVVAEQPTYFAYEGGAALGRVAGGATVLGVTRGLGAGERMPLPSAAPCSTGEQLLVIFNPSDEAARVAVVPPVAAGSPSTETVTLPPRSRRRLLLPADPAAPGAERAAGAVTVLAAGAEGVVVECVDYFHYGGRATEGASHPSAAPAPTA